MKRRYVLAPQAARDLVQIWRYIKKESSQETADRVESVIRKCRLCILLIFRRRTLTARPNSPPKSASLPSIRT